MRWRVLQNWVLVIIRIGQARENKSVCSVIPWRVFSRQSSQRRTVLGRFFLEESWDGLAEESGGHRAMQFCQTRLKKKTWERLSVYTGPEIRWEPSQDRCSHWHCCRSSDTERSCG